MWTKKKNKHWEIRTTAKDGVGRCGIFGGRRTKKLHVVLNNNKRKSIMN